MMASLVPCYRESKLHTVNFACMLMPFQPQTQDPSQRVQVRRQIAIIFDLRRCSPRPAKSGIGGIKLWWYQGLINSAAAAYQPRGSKPVS